MFWGILITIASATLFRSYWVLLGSIFCVGIAYFFGLKKSLRGVLWYLGGVVLSLGALGWMYYSFSLRSQVSLDGALTGLVVDQRSNDTWVIETSGEQLLLRSKEPLLIGDQILFQTHFTRASLPLLSRGETVLPMFLLDEFLFDRRLATKSYLGRGSVSDAQVMVISSQQDSLSFFASLRYTYKEYISHIFGPTPTAALLLGLTTGDRSGFSRQIYTTFVESGLVHLLAVSGSNVVYVSLLLGIVLVWVPFNIRIIVISGGLVMYGLFCGADSSVLRAITMGVLGLITTWTGRVVGVYRLMHLAAGGMLLVNPLILWYDLGFLLTFSAVGGIIIITDLYRQIISVRTKKRFDSLFLGRILPTAGATLGVLPVLILWTGKMSISSILINLLVVPFVPLFLLVGGVGMVMYDWLLLHELLAWMSNWLFFFASWGSTQGSFLFVDSGIVRLVFVGVYTLGVLRIWSMIILFLKKKLKK